MKITRFVPAVLWLFPLLFSAPSVHADPPVIEKILATVDQEYRTEAAKESFDLNVFSRTITQTVAANLIAQFEDFVGGSHDLPFEGEGVYANATLEEICLRRTLENAKTSVDAKTKAKIESKIARLNSTSRTYADLLQVTRDFMDGLYDSGRISQSAIKNGIWSFIDDMVRGKSSAAFFLNFNDFERESSLSQSRNAVLMIFIRKFQNAMPGEVLVPIVNSFGYGGSARILIPLANYFIRDLEQKRETNPSTTEKAAFQKKIVRARDVIRELEVVALAQELGTHLSDFSKEAVENPDLVEKRIRAEAQNPGTTEPSTPLGEIMRHLPKGTEALVTQFGISGKPDAPAVLGKVLTQLMETNYQETRFIEIKAGLKVMEPMISRLSQTPTMGGSPPDDASDVSVSSQVAATADFSNDRAKEYAKILKGLGIDAIDLELYFGKSGANNFLRERFLSHLDPSSAAAFALLHHEGWNKDPEAMGLLIENLMNAETRGKRGTNLVAQFFTAMGRTHADDEKRLEAYDWLAKLIDKVTLDLAPEALLEQVSAEVALLEESGTAPLTLEAARTRYTSNGNGHAQVQRSQESLSLRAAMLVSIRAQFAIPTIWKRVLDKTNRIQHNLVADFCTPLHDVHGVELSAEYPGYRGPSDPRLIGFVAESVIPLLSHLTPAQVMASNANSYNAIRVERKDGLKREQIAQQALDQSIEELRGFIRKAEQVSRQVAASERASETAATPEMEKLTEDGLHIILPDEAKIVLSAMLDRERATLTPSDFADALVRHFANSGFEATKADVLNSLAQMQFLEDAKSSTFQPAFLAEFLPERLTTSAGSPTVSAGPTAAETGAPALKSLSGYQLRQMLPGILNPILSEQTESGKYRERLNITQAVAICVDAFKSNGFFVSPEAVGSMYNELADLGFEGRLIPSVWDPKQSFGMNALVNGIPLPNWIKENVQRFLRSRRGNPFQEMLETINRNLPEGEVLTADQLKYVLEKTNRLVKDSFVRGQIDQVKLGFTLLVSGSEFVGSSSSSDRPMNSAERLNRIKGALPPIFNLFFQAASLTSPPEDVDIHGVLKSCSDRLSEDLMFGVLPHEVETALVELSSETGSTSLDSKFIASNRQPPWVPGFENIRTNDGIPLKRWLFLEISNHSTFLSLYRAVVAATTRTENFIRPLRLYGILGALDPTNDPVCTASAPEKFRLGTTIQALASDYRESPVSEARAEEIRAEIRPDNAPSQFEKKAIWTGSGLEEQVLLSLNRVWSELNPDEQIAATDKFLAERIARNLDEEGFNVAERGTAEEEVLSCLRRMKGQHARRTRSHKFPPNYLDRIALRIAKSNASGSRPQTDEEWLGNYVQKIWETMIPDERLSVISNLRELAVRVQHNVRSNRATHPTLAVLSIDEIAQKIRDLRTAQSPLLPEELLTGVVIQTKGRRTATRGNGPVLGEEAALEAAPVPPPADEPVVTIESAGKTASSSKADYSKRVAAEVTSIWKRLYTNRKVKPLAETQLKEIIDEVYSNMKADFPDLTREKVAVSIYNFRTNESPNVPPSFLKHPFSIKPSTASKPAAKDKPTGKAAAAPAVASNQALTAREISIVNNLFANQDADGSFNIETVVTTRRVFQGVSAAEAREALARFVETLRSANGGQTLFQNLLTKGPKGGKGKAWTSEEISILQTFFYFGSSVEGTVEANKLTIPKLTERRVREVLVSSLEVMNLSKLVLPDGIERSVSIPSSIKASADEVAAASKTVNLQSSDFSAMRRESELNGVPVYLVDPNQNRHFTGHETTDGGKANVLAVTVAKVWRTNAGLQIRFEIYLPAVGWISEVDYWEEQAHVAQLRAIVAAAKDKGRGNETIEMIVTALAEARTTVGRKAFPWSAEFVEALDRQAKVIATKIIERRSGSQSLKELHAFLDAPSVRAQLIPAETQSFLARWQLNDPSMPRPKKLLTQQARLPRYSGVEAPIASTASVTDAPKTSSDGPSLAVAAAQGILAKKAIKDGRARVTSGLPEEWMRSALEAIGTSQSAMEKIVQAYKVFESRGSDPRRAFMEALYTTTPAREVEHLKDFDTEVRRSLEGFQEQFRGELEKQLKGRAYGSGEILKGQINFVLALIVMDLVRVVREQPQLTMEQAFAEAMKRVLLSPAQWASLGAFVGTDMAVQVAGRAAITNVLGNLDDVAIQNVSRKVLPKLLVGLRTVGTGAGLVMQNGVATYMLIGSMNDALSMSSDSSRTYFLAEQAFRQAADNDLSLPGLLSGGEGTLKLTQPIAAHPNRLFESLFAKRTRLRTIQKESQIGKSFRALETGDLTATFAILTVSSMLTRGLDKVPVLGTATMLSIVGLLEEVYQDLRYGIHNESDFNRWQERLTEKRNGYLTRTQWINAAVDRAPLPANLPWIQTNLKPGIEEEEFFWMNLLQDYSLRWNLATGATARLLGHLNEVITTIRYVKKSSDAAARAYLMYPQHCTTSRKCHSMVDGESLEALLVKFRTLDERTVVSKFRQMLAIAQRSDVPCDVPGYDRATLGSGFEKDFRNLNCNVKALRYLDRATQEWLFGNGSMVVAMNRLLAKDAQERPEPFAARNELELSQALDARLPLQMIIRDRHELGRNFAEQSVIFRSTLDYDLKKSESEFMAAILGPGNGVFKMLKAH